MEHELAVAILVAAGRGERLGHERPKAFVPLAGEPLLLHAARAFEAASSIGALVVVVPEAELTHARAVLAPLGKLRAVVAGGARRQDSVRAGLEQVDADFAGVVLVHDAARPLVEPALVDAVVVAAQASGAALPVVPLVDTIKQLEGERVTGTLDRTSLAAAQTPQGFRRELLERAYAAASRTGVELTDECMAVERLGELVATIPGSPANRKITTPEDLEWAEQVLAQRLQERR